MVRFAAVLALIPECDYVRPLKSQADGGHIVKILEGAALCPEVWRRTGAASGGALAC